MPLHSNGKVVWGVELHGLDDIIQRAKGSDAKVIADTTDRLMMAGIAFRLQNTVSR